MEARVWHYDGRNATRHHPLLALADDGAQFTLSGPEVDPGPYRFADLEPQGFQAGGGQYGLKRRPGWRIGFTETPPAEIAALLPRPARYGRLIDRVGLWPSVGILAVLAVAVVFGVMALPSLIVPLVPRSAEARLGNAMIGDFGRLGCNSAAGNAAVRALATRLGAPPDTDIRVIRVPVVNAVALPGGHIVLFDGLIQSARSPDEVAGVLGHELGHVEHRDGLEALIRRFGLQLLTNGFDSNVAGYTNALASASYSRKAESRADDFAITALDRAHVSPGPTAALFHRLGAEEGTLKNADRMFSYFASHPLSAEREARFNASARAGSPYTPALDPDQWRALRTMCSN